jgi:hypothetical protein
LRGGKLCCRNKINIGKSMIRYETTHQRGGGISTITKGHFFPRNNCAIIQSLVIDL